MSKKDKFFIDIYNLKNGEHQYTFDIDDQFFSYFGDFLTEHGKGEAGITVDKTDHLINVLFDIDVKVELTCDRTLEQFEYPIQKQEKLIFKYGEEEKELDADIIMITRETQRINLGRHLFDYIGLSIPYKKLHPRFAGEDKEQDELIFQTRSDEEENTNAEDPRWEALKKLKNKE